jgi:hypothetical protein
MHEYGPFSTVNYYPNTPDFRKFKGIDMIPENRANYVRSGPFEKNLNFEGKSKANHEDMMMHQCRVPKDDGSTWHVQRVGPFTSTGGYDWWQLGWSDAGMLSEALRKHPEGIDVLNTILVPVLEDGTRLSHPPIHIHHIHFVAQQGVRFRNIARGICVSSSGTTQVHMDTLVKEKNCYNSSLFLEQHGDYECKKEDDGIECLTAGHHNTRRIRQILDIEGELNDVRPFNSDPIRWYYQIALKWRPIQPDVRPVSQMTIMAPGETKPDDQLTRVITFPTPTHKPHFIWYTGNFWADGEALRNKLHAHNLVFESAGFFLGTPEDLGLDKKRFRPKVSYLPMATDELGFRNNDELANFLLTNLKTAQQNSDRLCSQGIAPNDNMCSRPRPRWVSAAIYDSEEFQFYESSGQSIGFKMDRRPKTWSEPFTFRKGDPFTVIAFSRKLERPTIPPYPNVVPPIVPGHISWHFWYYHKGWYTSFFGRIVCNQEGIFFDASEKYGLADVAGIIGSVLLEGGVPVGQANIRFIKYSFFGVLIASFVAIAYAISKKKKD